MSKFGVEDLADVQRSITLIEHDIADIDDEALKRGAEIIRKAHRDEIVGLNLVGKTGRLKDSIRYVIKRNNWGEHYALIYPTGTHHVPKSGKTVSNSDVGFIHEFGAPSRNIGAKQWMKSANAKAADEAYAAIEKVLSARLEKLGL